MPQPAPPPAPRSIRSAATFMYVGAALTGIGGILVIVGLLASGPAVSALGVSAAKSSTNVGVLAAVFAASAAIEIGLWLWMAWAVKRGKGWARIVSTVLFAVNVVLTLINVAGGKSAIPGLVILLVGLGAVIQLWKAESSAFFAAQQSPAGWAQPPG